LIEGWGVYIAAVFEGGRFGKFEYNGSFEGFGGDGFSGELFIVEVFFVFSSGGMKDLSVSITFCRIVALTNSAI
jgi:hypothetical protein